MKDVEIHHFNFRVMRRTLDGENDYAFYEVFYNKKGEIIAWTSEPVSPAWRSLAEFREKVLGSLGKPVLDYDELEEGLKKNAKMRSVRRRVAKPGTANKANQRN